MLLIKSLIVADDADIFIVGNKCDKLTKSDRFSASELPNTLEGLDCVGHVYTSALEQQGIVGLRQLILCSKSQLTEGHYTEFAQIPKVSVIPRAVQSTGHHSVNMFYHRSHFKRVKICISGSITALCNVEKITRIAL